MQIVKSVAWNGTPYRHIQTSVCILMILMIEVWRQKNEHFCGCWETFLFKDHGSYMTSKIKRWPLSNIEMRFLNCEITCWGHGCINCFNELVHQATQSEQLELVPWGKDCWKNGTAFEVSRPYSFRTRLICPKEADIAIYKV